MDFRVAGGEPWAIGGPDSERQRAARVLTASPERHLASTDISDYALEALKASAVERVVVVGRRGHVQAAFTVKELRELTKLEGATFVVAPEALEAGMNASSEVELKERVAKRKNKLLVASAGRSPVEQEKVIELQFYCSFETCCGGRMCFVLFMKQI